MSDIDREVKMLLDRMAAEAGHPGPPPESLARRTATRRGSMVMGVVAVIGAALIAGNSMTDGFRDGTRRHSVAVGATPTQEDPSQGSPPQEMQGDLVAQGENGSINWWLSAYRDGSNLCTEFFTEEANGGGGGGGCGGVDLDRHPIGLSTHSGDDSPSATGHVPLAVERLDMVMTDGSTSTVTEFYEAPEGVGFPIKFYVVIPFPEETDGLVAYDGAGDVVGRQEVFGPDDEPKISRVAGPFVIDEGQHEGIPYLFKGYVETQEPADSGPSFFDGDVEKQELSERDAWTYPCHEFLFGKREEFGGGGGCDIPLARGHHVNYSQQSFDSDPAVMVVHGSVKPAVDRVIVEMESGKVYEAEMFEVDGTDFRFFLVFPETSQAGVPGEVVAYRGADEVERVPLCGHDMASAGGSCGP